MNNRIEATKDRKDLEELVSLLTDVCSTVTDIECSISVIEQTPELNIMQKSAILSKAITANPDSIDIESINDVIKDNNIDSEALRDKVSIGINIVRELFKSTRQKLFEATDNSRTVWVSDNSDKLKSLYEDLASRVNTTIDNNTLLTMNKLMGDNLSVVKDGKINIDELLSLAKDMTQSFKLEGTTNIDRSIGDMIKRKDTKITGSDYIKVTRLDGKNLSYIVIGEEYGVRGVRYYDSVKLPSNKSVLSSNDINIEYAKKLLDTASVINNLLPDIGASIRTELSYVEDSIKDISDKSKWKTGKDGLTIGSLSIYVGTALLVAFGVYAGGVPIIANMVKQVGVASVNMLSTIIKGYMRLAPKTKALIGAASIFGSPAVYNNLLPKWFKTTSKEIDESDDDSYYRMMEDKAKIKLLNARVELTTRYSLDAIYGMYFIVLELMSTASIIIEHLDKKGE